MYIYTYVCLYRHTLTSELALIISLSFSNNPPFMLPAYKLYWHRSI